MTVQDSGRLQDFDPEAEIRLMTQQQWPFENDIAGICDSRDLLACSRKCGCCKDDCPDCYPDDAEQVVSIVEGQQLGYGNKNAGNVTG